MLSVIFTSTLRGRHLLIHQIVIATTLIYRRGNWVFEKAPGKLGSEVRTGGCQSLSPFPGGALSLGPGSLLIGKGWARRSQLAFVLGYLYVPLELERANWQGLLPLPQGLL
jgi:hypothetical protein